MKIEYIKERLIIFTRYPEPGKTKTRLISALGEKGAASFQRQMTEYTVMEARKLQSKEFLSIEIHFAGGNYQLMKDWLGENLIYREQGEGDLGHKMKSAFARAFAEGIHRVVLIGTDCPDMNVTIMNRAFEALAKYDLVLGPALDGGYYLIGLFSLISELFIGIDWGTSQVFAKTEEIAQKLNLRVEHLDLLQDIDRPEDLNKFF